MSSYFFLLLLFPLPISFAFIRLSFLSWYERELRIRKALIIGFFLSIILVCGLIFVLSKGLIPTVLLMIYNQVVISIFLLGIAQLVYSLFWIRKGVQSAFLVTTVASYISLFWLIFPVVYYLIIPLDALRVLAASYFSGAIVGTLVPIAVIEEVRIKEGLTTVSIATSSLSAADAVSKTLVHQSVFPSYTVQLIIFTLSFVISSYLYKKLVK